MIEEEVKSNVPERTNMEITEFTTRWVDKAADIPGRMELLFDQVRNVSEKVEEFFSPNVDLTPTDEWPEMAAQELVKGTWEWALHILHDKGGKIRLPEWLGYWFKHEEGWTAAFTRHGEIVQAWFDRGYQERDDWEEVHGLSFEWALTALKSGKKVRRSGWNGKGMYIWLMPEMKVPKEWIKEKGLLDACNAGNGEYVHCEPAIRIFTAQKTVSTGWKPSNLDMFANDWELA